VDSVRVESRLRPFAPLVVKLQVNVDGGSVRMEMILVDLVKKSLGRISDVALKYFEISLIDSKIRFLMDRCSLRKV
jgi:hypothetical protein